MSQNPADSPHIEIQSDEDWKERVKSEDRARDQQAAAQSTATPQPAAATDSFPRADFSILVQMFATQAMTALGLIPPPGAKEPAQHLPLARHFIDLLGVLEQKCRGNLTSYEEKLLTTSLHELRLAFVELNRQAASAPATAADSQSTPSGA